MKTAQENLLRYPLGILLGIVALNAFGGGYYGMAGAEGLPPEWLAGSPFKSYLIPSIFLFVVIGGACLYTTIAVFRRSKSAKLLSIGCAILLASWIIIQVSILGYVSWMQPTIMTAAIVILTLGLLLPKRTDKLIRQPQAA